MNVRQFVMMIPLAAIAAGCTSGNDANVARGRGLKATSLSPAAEARVYEAAAGSAFDLGDPSLSLLLDPRRLTRAEGYAPGPTVPSSVVAAMRDIGMIKGTCQPTIGGKRRTPLCKAATPGYLLRFTDILRVGGDTVEVYMAVRQYDTPSSGASAALEFERAYQVVGRGTSWRSIREARIPKPDRPR